MSLLFPKECELEVALLESKKDIEQNKFNSGSVDDHLERIPQDGKYLKTPIK